MANLSPINTSQVIRFTKMHGIGNDYIYIDCMESEPDRLPDLAREMSDRHFGVGGDGIVLICPPTSPSAHYRMRMFNSDGSEARMCGNASRCIAAWIHNHRNNNLNPINLETLSGIKVLTINKEGDNVLTVTVDMGEPAVGELLKRVDTGIEELEVSDISMGNPHGVIFVDNLAEVDFDRLGPLMEHHPMWPDRANIEFAQVVSPSLIKVRVWERGTGETLACGTGACATAVAARLTGRCADNVVIRLRGGDLHISWDGNPDSHVLMTGPATEVFTGQYIRQNT
ncbi:MAG: diaminopimelate epimerase [Muribaculaceae bacterium]|nr:diaminopimelate epimerase [Muribaculaceae bacterium]